MLLFFVSLLTFTTPARACGPFFAETLFAPRSFPDAPLDRFAAGEAGFVHDGLWDSYLVVSWRALQGVPLRPADQEGALRAWAEEQRFDTTPVAGVDAWNKRRKGQAPDVTPDRFNSDDYTYTTVCLSDAFLAAIRTQDDRTQRWGADSPWLSDWNQAQDRVFAACGDPSAPAPAPAPEGAPKMLKQDRAYQMAAHAFYTGRYDDALARFTKMSQNPRTPYQKLAKYLLARTKLRAALAAPEDTRAAALQGALDEILAQVSDPRSPYLPALRRLEGFVRVRLDPKAYRDLLAERLQAGTSPEFGQDLRDFSILMDRDLPPPTDALGGWLFDWKRAEDPTTALVERWKKKRSLPNLLAAISRVGAGHAAAGELMRAAADVGPDHPAAPSLVYHLARLTAGAGNPKAARSALDAFLRDQGGRLSRATQNRLTLLRGELAASPEEFWRFNQIVPYGVGFEEYGTFNPESPDLKLEPVLPPAAATVLGLGMPQAKLTELVLRSDVLPEIKPHVVSAAWVRAVLLHDEASQRRLAPELAKLVPALADGLRQAQAAATPEERAFLSTLLLLRNPGLRYQPDAGRPRLTALHEIDDFRDNWWCLPTTEVPRAAFVSDAEWDAAMTERAALEKLGIGPNALGPVVIAWAKAHPTDARAAEALHLTVRATRYACDSATPTSKAAFQLLHKLFPESEWAKKTKYYY